MPHQKLQLWPQPQSQLRRLKIDGCGVIEPIHFFLFFSV